jgi:HlyD family secretion protein
MRPSGEPPEPSSHERLPDESVADLDHNRRGGSRRRGWYVAAALLLAAAAAVGLWRWRAAARRPRSQVETAQVDRGRIVAKVTATGTLSAIVTVQVGSQVSGSVKALYADYNSRVKKGQLIAKIDPQLFEAAVEQARANSVAAQGNLAKSKAQAVDARRQYARNKSLAEQKLIAQADLDTSEANAQAADAQVKASEGAVEQTRAALHQAEVNLAYTNIVSPTNGVVISRNVDVGQTVAASLQAPTIFVIAEDLSKMQVDTSVAEADVGRLQDGMASSFTVDAYPGEVFRGRVRQIRNAPQTVQNVVTYDAVIDVENPELKLRPGMTANVTFVYGEKDDALRVPNAGLRFRPPPEMLAKASGGEGTGVARGGGGGSAPTRDRAAGRAPGASDERTVWVLRAGGPAPVRVRTGISDGSYTEVAEGALQAGDKVITDASASSGAPGGMAGAMRRPF